MRFTGNMGKRPKLIDLVDSAIFEKFYATSVVINGIEYDPDQLREIPEIEREVLSIVFENAAWIIVTDFVKDNKF